ncbi:NrsF family protein [Methylobacterium nigriterrae]|uniref:NrsF family protein n=1 Tax=Methylobacterium nigriterrae TaxID=3127512 RepID=UPI003013F183
MSDTSRHDGLVEDLVGGLRPVRRLPPPGLRALAWIAAALALALLLMPMADLDGMRARMEVADLRIAAVAAALTAVTAAFAAFQVSVPGRPLRWALLPVAPALAWIGASGLGCLRGVLAPGANIADAHEMGGCFTFLVGVSLPLSGLLVVMLRRACPLHPNLTAALGGLAAAAAAAALLVPFHPHDATATDLLMHLLAVLAVIGANGIAGGRLLAGGRLP